MDRASSAASTPVKSPTPSLLNQGVELQLPYLIRRRLLETYRLLCTSRLPFMQRRLYQLRLHWPEVEFQLSRRHHRRQCRLGCLDLCLDLSSDRFCRK